MGEVTMAHQMGAQDGSIGFIVRTVSDEAYELLGEEDQLRVQRGQGIVIENSGNTRVLDFTAIALQEGVETKVAKPTAIVPAGTFGWIQEDTEVPCETFEVDGLIFRQFDISGTDPRLSGFGNRLNGNAQRATKLAKISLVEGVLHHGIIKGAQILGTSAQGVPGTIMARPSNEPNEATRVGAVFTLPTVGSYDSYVLLRSRYSDLQKAANTVRAMI